MASGQVTAPTGRTHGCFDHRRTVKKKATPEPSNRNGRAARIRSAKPVQTSTCFAIERLIDLDSENSRPDVCDRAATELLTRCQALRQVRRTMVPTMRARSSVGLRAARCFAPCVHRVDERSL